MRKLSGVRTTERSSLLSEYGKQKLIGYADSFKEIAKALEEDTCRNPESEAESRQNCLYQQRLWENRCMLADNLQEMAGVMARVAAEVFSYRPFPERRERMVQQALRAEGIRAGDLYYIENAEGKSRISLTLQTEQAGGYRAEEAADMLSVLLGQRLVPSMNCPYLIEKQPRSYVFAEEARYVVLTGAARAVKEQESRSGDNYAVLESEKGNITMLLSDGMGSGEKACRDSESVLDLMEKLIEAGYRPKAAANLVNTALLARGEEQNMSTLDICEMDLYDGICEFTKIGAAASFIKRDHMVEQISSGTLPLGIFKSMECEGIQRQLMDGDYVFLLSDGIADAMEENDHGEELCEVIGNLRQENPRELAEALLHNVLCRTRGHIRDDMTVLVLGIWENR